MCFLGRVRFTGEKDTLSAVQYTIIRYLPGYIAFEATLDSLIRRQLVLTFDDIVWMAIFVVVTDCQNHLTEGDHIPNFFRNAADDEQQDANANRQTKKIKPTSPADRESLGLIKEREKICLTAEFV